MIQAWLIFYRRFKFLPLTFGIGLLALILRIEVAQDHARNGIFITTAFSEADDKKPAAAPAADTKATDKPTDKAATPDAKATDKPADAPPKDPLSTDNQEMRPSGELSILKDLADRRTKIQQREAELDDREALLKVGEKQFDQKLKQLTDLRNEIKTLLTAAQAQQDEETKRLVDIYEKMKPKEAADIFSNMTMNILFPIVHGMKEAKLSPILAAMPADKARLITGTLAERAKVLPDDSQAQATAAVAAPPPPPLAPASMKPQPTAPTPAPAADSSMTPSPAPAAVAPPTATK